MSGTTQLNWDGQSNPIRNLQYMLRRLAGKYDFLPDLAVDGIFGENTLEAVMLFQRELFPPVTGVVDRNTWDAIVKEWSKWEQEQSPPRMLRIFPGEGREVQPGAGGGYLILPQMIFEVLRNKLEGIVSTPLDGVHGVESVQNTKWLQNLAQLEETGVMNRETWDMLTRLYELFVTADERKKP